MLTKEQIKKKLQEDPSWEPSEDASYEEWELYDEVRDELEGFDSSKLKLEDDDEDEEDDAGEDW